jgi:hypothetical protein
LIKADYGVDMRRAALVALVLVAVLSAMPSADAVPRGRTFVTKDCRHADIRPRQIMFACADGGFFMTQGEWMSWHRFRAVGAAVFHLNDCSPSCAGGTFHTVRGRIVLHRRERCPDARRHHHVFTRATIRFTEPLLGRHRERAKLFCPNH